MGCFFWLHRFEFVSEMHYDLRWQKFCLGGKSSIGILGVFLINGNDRFYLTCFQS